MKHLICLLLAACMTSSAVAQDPGSEKLMQTQKDAMKKLAMLDGVWRGPAWTMERSKGKHELTQTERVGSFLDGTIKVIEGRGYEPSGQASFNALGIISYDVQKQAYRMKSYAMGYSGEFPVTIIESGFSWERPAGPAMTIRYTATIKDGQWKEVGELLQKDKPTVQIFEMTLKRVSDTNWPSEGAIPPK